MTGRVLQGYFVGGRPRLAATPMELKPAAAHPVTPRVGPPAPGPPRWHNPMAEATRSRSILFASG